MKKIILLITIILLIISSNSNSEEQLLRIRIVANSNSEHDQLIKTKISNDVKKELYILLKDETNIENARKLIKEDISNIEKIVDTNLIEEDYGYTVKYGLNYFPEKEYNGKHYKEGEYESLLISLGDAKGDNWWCILFPPICLIESSKSDEKVEYRWFFKDLITNIFD